MKITFVLWDDETDGVAVKHDGETVWSESSFDGLDQYLRFYAPTADGSHEISWEVVEGGVVSETSERWPS